MTLSNVQTVTDASGEVTAVIVPIELWNEISAEIETRYLLKSEVMRQRLSEGMASASGIPLDEVVRRLSLEAELK